VTSFVFVTQSANKLAEAERILNTKLERYDLDSPEIQAVEVEEVVKHKALYAYQALGGKPVIIEDTGLYIEAWNGLPGALIKWFVQRVGVAGICQMLQNFPERKAWAETIVATYDGQLRIFKGKVEGRIALSPAGDGGFGWDSVFIPADSDKTFAQMTPAEKDQYSMRRQAFEAMADYYTEDELKR
jgi:non-canonical purine NTP pyrophosphatase (RdgB/HAM1 family)